MTRMNLCMCKNELQQPVLSVHTCTILAMSHVRAQVPSESMQCTDFMHECCLDEVDLTAVECSLLAHKGASVCSFT